MDTNTNGGKSLIFHLAEEGDLEMLKCLMDNNPYVNINVKDKNERTPLSYAAGHGHLDVVEYLISKGANFEPTDASFARKSGHDSVANYISGMSETLVSKSGNYFICTIHRSLNFS